MTTDEKPTIVNYPTFVRDLTESKVSQVDTYERGEKIDLTYRTVDGELRATKGPFARDEDALLTYTLESRSVPFTAHAEEYEGTGTSLFWLMQIMSFSFLLVPILLILVILRQAKTIRTLGEALARHSKPAD